MNEEDQRLVIRSAIEEAFALHVANLYAVYLADVSPEGLKRFMAGLRKGLDALSSIEEELP